MSEEWAHWIKTLVSRRDAADRELDRAVFAARGRGASWREIGKAVGLSHGGAWKRWRHMEDGR